VSEDGAQNGLRHLAVELPCHLRTSD
jgi:hypothetical protein